MLSRLALSRVCPFRACGHIHTFGLKIYHEVDTMKLKHAYTEVFNDGTGQSLNLRYQRMDGSTQRGGLGASSSESSEPPPGSCPSLCA
jgi:hypothetical protein